jgi:hypothetical protein
VLSVKGTEKDGKVIIREEIKTEKPTNFALAAKTITTNCRGFLGSLKQVKLK